MRIPRTAKPLNMSMETIRSFVGVDNVTWFMLENV
jgi:hypothetical protein